MALRFEFCAKCSGTAILPDDRVIDGLAGGAIPDDCGFALVGDADGGNIAGLHFSFGQRFLSDGELGGGDFCGIVLYPSGLGKNLLEFALRDGVDAALVIE